MWCFFRLEKAFCSVSSLASQPRAPVMKPQSSSERCHGLHSTCHAWITDLNQSFVVFEFLSTSSAQERDVMCTKAVSGAGRRRCMQSPVGALSTSNVSGQGRRSVGRSLNFPNQRALSCTHSQGEWCFLCRAWHVTLLSAITPISVSFNDDS